MSLLNLNFKSPFLDILSLKANFVKLFSILFFSISEEPFRENPLSLHEGQTVRKGEKFICTKWLTRTEESENEEDDFVSSDEADAD